MGTWLPTWLSKETTSAALSTSEMLLLVFGIVLVVGLVGELKSGSWWQAHRRLFEIVVIVGVAGELIGDGGIFLFSRQLETMADLEIARLNKEALELSRLIQPRRIEHQIAVELFARLARHEGQHFKIAVDARDNECAYLALQIRNVLREARWIDDGPIAPLANVQGFPQAVHVFGASPKTEEAALDVVDALVPSAIVAYLNPSEFSPPPIGNPTEIVLISVWPKPILE